MNHAPPTPDPLDPGLKQSERRLGSEQGRSVLFPESAARQGRQTVPALPELPGRLPPAPAPDASPLELLLDPGLGLRSHGSRCLGGARGPGLSSLGELQLMQLLETPELPAYRLSRSDPAPAEPTATPGADWALRPPSERGRHDALPAPLPSPEAGPADLPPAAPRPYVLGALDQATVDASLRALAGHEPELPDIGSSTHMRMMIELGEGESTFLNARSALWSWRPHRQAGVKVHTHGPPVVGRDVLLEQRAGLVTVLQGCRVLTLLESEHDWGFTLGSLSGQVYHLWERLLIERHPDDRVTLLISSHHEVALRGFGLVGGILNSARRSAVQGYARGMSALAEV